MFQALRQIFARSDTGPVREIPPGERVYAVGDIHGRLDLFSALADAINDDDSRAGKARTTVILLGDLVDRGPASAQVIDFARRWQEQRKVRILTGNHEEMFLRSFDDLEMFRHFLRHGGRETIMSYGVPRRDFVAADLQEAQAIMRRAVPEADRAFLEGFEDMISIGDYLFVHAGIDPGVPLGEQRRQDLRWIREPFLSHGEPHELMIVHGHTIREEPDECSNRIGIDTGAFMSGRLTALMLEGASRRFIEAAEQDDASVAVSSYAK